MAKYDTLATNYNHTRNADPYLVDRFIHHLHPFLEGVYLDIGCGTGNYTSTFNKKGFHFIGIDPSIEMLDKAMRHNPEIDWKLGSAENTQLKSHSINGITAMLTIHHWSNLKVAFRELNRVLKPAGHIVLFTSTPEQMKGYWLNHYFPKMMEHSIFQMPDLEKVEQAMKGAGISIIATEKYSILPDLKDMFLYSGKFNPSLYFSSTFRQGISSFTSLANIQEVDAGLHQLKEDIISEKIVDVIDSYNNDLGDYIFIIGQKMD